MDIKKFKKRIFQNTPEKILKFELALPNENKT